jgi:hypothetical protein
VPVPSRSTTSIDWSAIVNRTAPAYQKAWFETRKAESLTPTIRAGSVESKYVAGLAECKRNQCKCRCLCHTGRLCSHLIVGDDAPGFHFRKV